MLLRSITKHVKDQNWFAVALDFFIVVLGVGVAMFGQQWLGDRQQRADMVTAEIALQSDMFYNYVNAKERLAVARCRTEAYQAIAAQLLEPDENWTGMPRINNDSTFQAALPVVFRSPSRNWGSRVWKAELARGTFSQMADQRRDNLDSLFVQTDHARDLQDDIYTLQGRLKTLAVATKVSQSDRLRYYDVLGEIDDKSGLFEHIASQIIQSIEDLGIDRRPEAVMGVVGDVQDTLEQLNERGQSIYGACFVPMDWPALDVHFTEEVK